MTTGAPRHRGTDAPQARAWQRVLRASVPLCVGASFGCTDPRERPVPPQVLISFTTLQVTSPDTLVGLVYAYDDDGLERLELRLTSPTSVIGDSTILLDGSFEVNRNIYWFVPSGLSAGSRLVYRVRAVDFTTFATSDSTVLTIQ